MSDIKFSDFKAYLLRNDFTESEIKLVNEYMTTFFAVFGTANMPLRRNIIMKSADRKPTELSLKLKKLMLKTKRYRVPLEEAYLGYGFRVAAR